jgi:LysM repeat protein
MTANKLSSSSSLKIGQKLMIPSKKTNASSNTESQVAKAPTAPTSETSVSKSASSSSSSASSQITHVVKAGESPTTIAKRYGVSVQSLMQSNNISDPKKVRVNQKLIIPVAKVTTPTSVPTAPSQQQDQELKTTASDAPLGYVKEASRV